MLRWAELDLARADLVSARHLHFLVGIPQSATFWVRAPKPGAQKVALWRSEVFQGFFTEPRLAPGSRIDTLGAFCISVASFMDETHPRMRDTDTREAGQGC